MNKQDEASLSPRVKLYLVGTMTFAQNYVSSDDNKSLKHAKPFITKVIIGSFVK